MIWTRSIQLRPLEGDDRKWAADFIQEHWGARSVVSRGRIHYPDELPGFIAVQEGRPVGLATYRMEGGECELVTLNSVAPGSGAGSALVNAVENAARSNGCRRIWLITTNDNLGALRFYQKRGFRLVAVHRNALEQSRKLKPQIPLIGMDGIRLRDEIELEIALDGGGDEIGKTQT